MSSDLSRAELRALLASRDLHDITAAADAARQDRHGRTTTVAVVQVLDPFGSHAVCPVTGIVARDGGFARTVEGLSDAVSDLVLLPPTGADADGVRATFQRIPAPPTEGEGMVPTIQIGTTDTWIDAGLDHDLEAWRAQGLRVVSDGIDPRHHPALGVDGAAKWTSFWHTASNAGLRGHATVLFGPHLDLDAVFAQIDAIEAVQAETGVFLSVTPSVIGPDGATADDGDATQASFDLRVMAACRLGLLGVDHVGYRVPRSDLKTAHTALLCGVDDLVVDLFLGARDRKADASAHDLSVREMRAWLEEAGFIARVRNAAFDAEDFDGVLDLLEDAS